MIKPIHIQQNLKEKKNKKKLFRQHLGRTILQKSNFVDKKKEKIYKTKKQHKNQT